MSKRSAIFSKNKERGWFLIFLICLNSLFLLIRLLTVFHFLFPRPRKKGDLILFPYAAVGSDGHTRRFVEYLPFLDQNRISYKLCNLQTDEEMRRTIFTGPKTRYKLYLSILWKRIWQVLEARKYKTAFIQRGLFAMYFDLKNPWLEKLLRKLNHHIVIDYWDAVYVKQSLLIPRTVEQADVITVTNNFIGDYFRTLGKPIIRFNIGVNTAHYIPKTNYQQGNELRVFWTGLSYNLMHLEKHLPLLRAIHHTIPLKLIVVCSVKLEETEIPVENHTWDKTTFFHLLHSADIGIYPEEDSVISKGKSTMKVMDFLATGLPMIGVPYGLPDEAENGKNMIIVRNDEEWIAAFKLLAGDSALRETLGKNGLQLINDHYSIAASFEVFLNQILKKNTL